MFDKTFGTATLSTTNSTVAPVLHDRSIAYEGKYPYVVSVLQGDLAGKINEIITVVNADAGSSIEEL
jgi:hypothetical protein